MLNSDFWSLIDSTRKAAQGDADEHLSLLQDALRELPPGDLISFQHWFDDYDNRADTWALWGAAYLIGGGCSDDGFMDFRGWLVSRGEKVFEAAVQDPDSLARAVKSDEDCQVEGFSQAARWIWCEKTGRDFADFPPSPLARPGGGTQGEPWEEDDLPRLFPKLAKKFG
ncbi:MAG TPA: DUF4240 domain-containing protein [Burkholderiaceae bacterium]|nr:DUF4240 domain-containing protein [Burkholderiaceae bacterium]